MTDSVESWTTGRLLSTAARLVERSWEARLREHGLTHAGLIALHCLQPGPLSQRELAKACRVTDQTMSRTVERLERSGFVARATDVKDERRQQVTLTESGTEVHRQIVDGKESENVLAGAVTDHAALRTQLVQLVAALGGTDLPLRDDRDPRGA